MFFPRSLSLFFVLWCLLVSAVSQAALPDLTISLLKDTETSSQNKIASLINTPGLVGDYARLRFAEQKMKSQNFTEALRLANRVQEDLLLFWKNVLLSEICLSKNKPHEALALLKTLPKEPEHDLFFQEGVYDSLYKRALLVKRQAKIDLNQNPQSETANLVAFFPDDDTLETYLKTAENLPVLSAEQKITRLNRLYAHRKYKNLPGLISPTEIKKASVSKELKCQTLFNLGSAMRMNKNTYDASLSLFTEMLDMGCDKDYRAKALYRIGSLKPSKGSSLPDKREQALLLLYREFPDHVLADDALYKLYKLMLTTGDTKQGNKYYDALMSLKKGDMKCELAFEKAFPHYQKQKYKTAVEFLEKAANTEATSDESCTKVLYWQARSWEQLNSKTNAKQLYSNIIAQYPFSFYAVLAAHKINKKISYPKTEKTEPPVPESDTDIIEAVNTLNQKGQHEGAKAILEFFLYEKSSWEQEYPAFLAQKLVESQNYRKALDLAIKKLNYPAYGPIQGTSDPLLNVYFPRVFPKQTKYAYEISTLPFGAIEGIMREESLFQASVMSHAGARGLMQLMPATAGLVKKGLSEIPQSADISNPKTNITLGAVYLNQMKNKFDDNLALAIMAYNAGPGNVKKWLKRFGHYSLDEFIETVPFEETKGYVKRVIRSMHVYGSLYNNTYFTNTDYLELTQKQNQRAP